MMMKTLVTGGAGFIGSHLVDRLVADGHEVTVLDNFYSGRMENLKTHASNPKVKVAQGDITQHESLDPHFQGIDWVFHLAGVADIVPSIENPILYHRTNVVGTVHVLEAAKKAKVKRFVYVASSTCYGIPDIYPTPETAPIRLMFPYAFTKWAGEQTVMHWGAVYKMPCLSLRCFNVYGPRSRTTGAYGAVFGVFLRQKIAGKPFTVVGDGTQTRDFTYVSDVTSALVTAAKSSVIGEILNVGSGATVSIQRLVQLLGGAVEYIPKRPGEPDCTFADIEKIKKMLGWKPKVSLEAGVKQMLEHLEDWKSAPLWDRDSISKATESWFKYLG